MRDVHSYMLPDALPLVMPSVTERLFGRNPPAYCSTVKLQCEANCQDVFPEDQSQVGALLTTGGSCSVEQSSVDSYFLLVKYVFFILSSIARVRATVLLQNVNSVV